MATFWKRWLKSWQGEMDLVPTKKVEMRGDTKVWGNLDCSDHGMVQFRILRLGHKTSSPPSASGEQTSVSSGSHGRQPWREKGYRTSVWFSRIISSRLTSGPHQCAGNQANVTRGLCRWPRSYWQNSDKKECTRGRSRIRWSSRNTKTRHAETRLEKTKSIWSWIWWGTWNANRMGFCRYIFSKRKRPISLWNVFEIS